MIKQTRKSADKRKVVAGCFQELLFLTTHGMIECGEWSSKPGATFGPAALYTTRAFIFTCSCTLSHSH